MAGIIAHLDKDGATIITAKTLVNILAGATGTASKFGVRNVGDRPLGISASLSAVQAAIAAVGANDGSGRLRIKKDPDTLSRPWGTDGPPTLALSAAAAGGVFASTGVKGYVVVAKKSTGRTVASMEATVNVDDTTKKVTLTWVNVTGNTGYEVHFTNTPGTYGASTLIAEPATDVVTFLHDGTAGAAGTPALVNTTGGAGPAYGSPPAGLDSTTAAFLLGQSAGSLEIGEETFYYINRVVPSNSTPAGNRRLGRIAVTEGT